MRSLPRLLAMIVTIGILASGCGGTSKERKADGSTSTLGRKVFTKNCASCHTLKAAKSTGVMGPNLDDRMPDSDTVKYQVTNGGSGMPAFGSQLSKKEIDAVAGYVASSAGK